MNAPTGRQSLVLGVSVVVVASVVAGLIVVGSPTQERKRKLDTRRVTDLQALAGALDTYWTRHGALPGDIHAVEEEVLLQPLTDPESGAAYTYRMTGEQSFELCASFHTDATDASPVRPKPTSRFGTWAHGQGVCCFALSVNHEKQ